MTWRASTFVSTNSEFMLGYSERSIGFASFTPVTHGTRSSLWPLCVHEPTVNEHCSSVLESY